MSNEAEILKTLVEINASLHGLSGSKYAIAIIASASGILGASIPAILQFFNSNRNTLRENERHEKSIKSEIITKQRQEWMNEIRASAKDMLAEYNFMYNIAISMKEMPNNADLDNYAREAQKHLYNIQLHLNENKPDQKAVIMALEELRCCVSDHILRPEKMTPDRFIQARNSVISSLSIVFNQTWKKIKSLE